MSLSKDESMNSSMDCNVDTSEDFSDLKESKELSSDFAPVHVSSFEYKEIITINDQTDDSKFVDDKKNVVVKSDESGSTPPSIPLHSNSTPIDESKLPDITDRSITSDVEVIHDTSKEGNGETTDTSLIVLNDSSEIEKNEEKPKLVTGTTEHIRFDLKPLRFPSSLAALKTTPNQNHSNAISDVLNDSTKSLPPNITSVRKKFLISVEISAVLHVSNEKLTGEIEKVYCDHNEVLRSFRSGSGYFGDKSTSPSSVGSSSITQFAIKPGQARYSVLSSSSSTSIASSASAQARAMLENMLFSSKRDEPALTEERINELKEKWLNSNKIFKVLDFLDRVALHPDSSIPNDIQVKMSPDEPVKEKLADIEESSAEKPPKLTRQKRQAKTKSASINLDREIPRKRLRRTDSSEIPLTNGNFCEGDSVFAKWSDRKFYAAVLGRLFSDGKWDVTFFDGNSKILSEECLIKAEEFTMVGHNVYASQGDSNFVQGIITGCESKNGRFQYIVARDKGDVSVPCQYIYITETQARQIRAKNSPPPPVLSPVMNSDKRSTRSKTRLLMDAQPSSSGLQKTTEKSSTYDSDDDGIEKIVNFNYVSGVEPESIGDYENGFKGKGKTVSSKRSARPKENDPDAHLLGPLPDEESELFKNLNFLLTCTRREFIPKVHNDSNMSETDAVSTDNENYSFSKIPFVKDRLKLQLELGGGTVYNDIDDIPVSEWKSSYLVSNRPNTTAKYIQCIAAGIKCICHEWVIRCCIKKERVDIQELPVGWSIERERFILCANRKPALLKQISLLVKETADSNFYNFWSKVCRLANIQVSRLRMDSNLMEVTAVLAEAEYRDEIIERAITYDIPLVTTSWLIQSLIEGNPRPFQQHKAYCPEFVDSD